MSEADNQARIRIEAAKIGMQLWRNNSGVTPPIYGPDGQIIHRPVRYGLANDSGQVNKVIKSGDLIGIAPSGQFVSIEVKPDGWRYTGKGREQAQENWRRLVNSRGGIAIFATSWGEVYEQIIAKHPA